MGTTRLAGGERDALACLPGGLDVGFSMLRMLWVLHEAHAMRAVHCIALSASVACRTLDRRNACPAFQSTSSPPPPPSPHPTPPHPTPRPSQACRAGLGRVHRAGVGQARLASHRCPHGPAPPRPPPGSRLLLRGPRWGIAQHSSVCGDLRCDVWAGHALPGGV
jgi:hypothetical protein